MYNPIFSYTDRLVNNLVKIEHNKTALQMTDLSYNLRVKLSTYVKALEILYMGNLINKELSFKEAEKIISGQRPTDMDDMSKQILSNFRALIEFNRSEKAANYPELDANIIKQLNGILITQWRDSWDIRFRNLNDRIDSTFDNFAELREIEIKSEAIDAEVDSIIEWYKFTQPALNSIIRLGIVVYRLIELSPFIAANKLSIISIVDYILIKNGLSSKIYSSTTRMFNNAESMLLTGYSMSRRANDLTTWLEAFCDSVAKELVITREDINKFVVEDEKSKQQPFLDLNKRQLKVLKYLQTVQTIKREDYCHMMDVSTMTAYRDLNDLLRKRLIKQEGEGRATKYKLATN